MLRTGPHWLTVLDRERKVVGVLALSDVVRAYRDAVRADAQRLTHLATGAGVLEIRLPSHSPLAGRTIATAGLPDGVLVVSLQRDDTVVPVSGASVLQPGDILTVLARPDRAGALYRLVG